MEMETGHHSCSLPTDRPHSTAFEDVNFGVEVLVESGLAGQDF